jgi:hypothetical protein
MLNGYVSLLLQDLFGGEDALKSYSVGKTLAKSFVTVDVLFNIA